MKLKTVLSIIAALAAPSVEAYAQTLKTKRLAIACETHTGAVDYWNIVDKRPADITIKDWYASIGCIALPGDLSVAMLDKFDGVVRGIVVINGKSFTVYFPLNQLWDVDNNTIFDSW